MSARLWRPLPAPRSRPALASHGHRRSVVAPVAGFTLCEVIVALAIFAIGALGSAGLLGLAAGTMSRADIRSEATFTIMQIGDSLALAGRFAGDGSRDLSYGVATWVVSRQNATIRIILTVRATTPGRVDHLSSLIVRTDSVPTLRVSWTGDSASSSWW